MGFDLALVGVLRSFHTFHNISFEGVSLFEKFFNAL